MRFHSLFSIAALISSLSTLARADDQPASWGAAVEVGLANLHAKDEHYSPSIYRGWLRAFAAELATERAWGRLAFTASYADGDVAARAPATDATVWFASAALGFERAVLAWNVLQRPARGFVAAGVRSTAWDMRYQANPAAPMQRFESHLLSHAVWLGVGTDWALRPGSFIAAHLETALASHIARPAYGLSGSGGSGSVFGGVWRSPWSAFQAIAVLQGRMRLAGPLGLGARYSFQTLGAPDPLPTRAFVHAVFISLDGSL